MIILDMAKYIDSQGLGVYDESGMLDSTIFIERQPPKPDNCISLHHRGGMSSSPKHGYDTPSIQIIIRGNPDDLVGTMALAHSVYNILHGFHGQPFITDGKLVIDCRCVNSSPTYIGQDADNRHEYSLNFIIEHVNKTKHRE